MATRAKRKRPLKVKVLSEEEKIEDFVKASAKKHGYLLISVLEDIQERYNYLPETALREVAKVLSMPLRDVYGVATFYRAFRLQPRGRHEICVCLGTACHVRGGQRVLEKLERDLNIKAGETTKDKNFTLETVNCLGACALGPIVVIDGRYYGNVTPTKVSNFLKEYQGEKRGVKDEKN